jgi:hypothetical protein
MHGLRYFLGDGVAVGHCCGCAVCRRFLEALLGRGVAQFACVWCSGPDTTGAGVTAVVRV